VTTRSNREQLQAAPPPDAMSPARHLDTNELEDRVSALFRRWPSLSDEEMTTLRDLYDELLRRAKGHYGGLS
jgi:hypothetical protein